MEFKKYVIRNIKTGLGGLIGTLIGSILGQLLISGEVHHMGWIALGGFIGGFIVIAIIIIIGWIKYKKSQNE